MVEEMLFPQGPVMTVSLKPRILFLTVKPTLVQVCQWTRTSSPGFGPALPPLMSPMNLEKLPEFSKLLVSQL